MKNKLNVSVLLMTCLFSVLGFANSDPVVRWTESTLLSTLTIDYNNFQTSLKKSSLHYVPSAWSAMNSFLGDNIATIKNDQLSLHPELVGPGTIAGSGTISSISYWRINQRIKIPELKTTFNFSVVVVSDSSKSYLIQSVNMTETNDS